jgi:predicted site-specific integrase-resolvase
MAQVPEHDTEAPPQLLTAKEVGAKLGGLHEETINRWARQGKIASITLPSGGRRFYSTTVDEILTARQAGAA